MLYNIICADPPWSFSDTLSMSQIKRGAGANYNLMSTNDIVNISIHNVIAKDAILALWVPSSLLIDGLRVMQAWGFTQKQMWIWVKIKNNPLEKIINILKKSKKIYDCISQYTQTYWFDDLLSFGMGRIGRNVHEVVLIGTKGDILNRVKNKSERTVFFDKITKHSAKPDLLQDKLDRIFPDADLNRLELFGRRLKNNWTVIGNQSPSSLGEDINYSLKRIKDI